MLEVAPLPVPNDLVSDKESEEQGPKSILGPKDLAAVVEELNRVLLEVKDRTPEVPKIGEAAEEPS